MPPESTPPAAMTYSSSSEGSSSNSNNNNNNREDYLNLSSCLFKRRDEGGGGSEGDHQSKNNYLNNAQFGRQDPSSLLTCDECKYTTESEVRFRLHFSEPRHVNHFRSMAYREPKKRQMWLKIWFNTLEKAEAENQDMFEVDEAEEDEFVRKEAMKAAHTGRRASIYSPGIRL